MGDSLGERVMSLASLIQNLQLAAIAEGMAESVYDDEAEMQPFYERTQAAKVALEDAMGEMLSALQRIAAEDPGGYFAAIALPVIRGVEGEENTQ